MEVGNDLPYRFLHISKQRLEVTEGNPCIVGRLWSHRLLGHAVSNEVHHTPVLLSHFHIGLTRVGLHEMQHPPVDVGHSSRLVFHTDVVGHNLNIALQHLYVGEDLVVDVLKHILGLLLPCRHDLIGVVNQAVAQRLDGSNFRRIDET